MRLSPAIARMELHGMPIDVAAHRAQIARWQTELAAAENALHRRIAAARSAEAGRIAGAPTRRVGRGDASRVAAHR